MEKLVSFQNHGQQIVGILHRPDLDGTVPGVVLCHGFTGTKSEARWIFVRLARRLASSGIAVLRFDFRGSGDSEGEFRNMTISDEVSDAKAAVTFLSTCDGVDRARIGILGFSLGGCVAACVAGDIPLLKAVVLWAPVSDPDVQFAPLLTEGITFPHEFSPGLFLGRAFVDELPRVDPVASLARSSAPVLILHGTNDQAVPAGTSQSFVDARASTGIPSERVLIDGADHLFGSAGTEEQVIDRTASWFARHLVSSAAEPLRTVTYADAGVDIEKANRTKELLKELVRRSYTPQVLTELGSFGGLFETDFGDVEDPVLVASTDGVGTKLKVAVAAGRHTTVGMDLVNHCVNDILVMGARPLFFMDYIALGRHDTQIVVDVVEGLSSACTAVGCALLGGETAEMPDMYRPGEYDLAGTIVGVVGKREVITGGSVRHGDVLIGLMSDGLHTNGYSLARKLIFDIAGWNTDTFVPEWGKTVADALLAPHRCYLHALSPLLARGMIHGMAHITGGGITDNVPRILPEGLSARVRTAAWDTPPIFRTLIGLGNLGAEEAFRAFNMGIGMVLVVDSASADTVLGELTTAGETAWLIGEVVSGDRNVQYV